MTERQSPRLRTVDKIKPLYPLNDFPEDFGFNVGREIIYMLATKSKPSLEGEEWEEIFANCIGAEWKPSNVGLDDIIIGANAWSAKTVKSNKPSHQKIVRLISGRNSPTYSYGDSRIDNKEANEIGGKILSIWNERVSAIRQKFKNLRTVVLIKSNNLEQVAIFEFETVRYDPELYNWEWNKNNNLEGFSKNLRTHRFTWQPHGSQFTIVEDVPEDSLIVDIKIPPKLNKEIILKGIGFDNSWVTVTKKNGG